MFLGCRYRRVTADTALPYRVRNLGLAVWLSRNGKVGKEEEVDQGIDQFFGQRFCLFELGNGCLDLGVFSLSFIKKHLILNGGSSRPFPPRAPKELLLP